MGLCAHVVIVDLALVPHVLLFLTADRTLLFGLDHTALRWLPKSFNKTQLKSFLCLSFFEDRSLT